MSKRAPSLLSYAVVAAMSATATYVLVPRSLRTPDVEMRATQQAPPASDRTRIEAKPIESDTPLVDRVLEVAEEVDPAMATRLREICDADPQEFDRVMRQSGQRLMGLVRLKQTDPALYQAKVHELRLDRQAVEIAVRHCQAVRAGDTDMAESLKERLHDLLRTQMALKLKVRGDSILRLEEHVEKLQADLERDASQFADVVENRLNHFIHQHDGQTECEPKL